MEQPYFVRLGSKKRRRRRVKAYAAIFFLLALATFGLYTLKNGSFFEVNAIVIVGIEDEERSALLRAVEPLVLRSAFTRFLGIHNYLSWPKRLSPPSVAFSALTVEKNWRRKQITLTAEKRTQYAIWCAETTLPEPAAATSTPSDMSRNSPPPPACFWFDRNGILFETAPATEGQLISRIDETAETIPALGSQILETQQLAYLAEIIDFLKSTKLSIASLSVERKFGELRAVTPRGTKIIFSLRNNPKETSALETLAEILKKEKISAIEYIDLTVPGKAYLKRR